MSKVLIINGANFSENKVETITIGDAIPCTGISISPTEIVLDSIGSTQQITASVTPVNTTDAVGWSSSNTDIATVVNGLVTCVGVGSVTITATCGDQSATCSVTSSVTINIKTGFAYDVGYTMSSTDIENGKDYVSQYGGGTAKGICVASDVETASGYFGFSGAEHIAFSQSTYPIMLPKGTTKITFTGVDKRTGVLYADSTQKTTAASITLSQQGVKALANRVFVTPTNGVTEYTVPEIEGLDSILFGYEYNNSVSDFTGDETITFS